MWWRMNQENSNDLIQNCKREQIQNCLPWIKELSKIAVKLDVDLECAKKMSKEGWKNLIKKKIICKTKEYIENELELNKRYKHNMKDDIIVGQKKRYTNLTQKKAKIWFRMRADIVDPAPRTPYHPINKWRCKLCPEKDQSTEHYIRHCPGTTEAFNGQNRNDVYQFIQKLDGNDEYLYQTTLILEKIYNLITN